MKKILYILMAFALLVPTSCSDFLERSSLVDLDDNTYWSSEGNVRLFVNGAYAYYFSGYSDNWGSVYAPEVYATPYNDDRTLTGEQPNILLSVPADNWYRNESTAYRGTWLSRRGSAPWNFAYVRKWNLLMERLDRMKEAGNLTDEGYNHWMGVARFLRGWEYSRMVQSFGDVPYYDKQVESSDFDAQFKDRDPRTYVMDQVKADFDYAMANVRVNDGVDYINRYVVSTVAARCMLFEGSWLTYHKNDAALKTCSDIDGHAKSYLQAAVDYAAVTINSGKYGFNKDFRTLFGTLFTTLTGTANEVLLYRVYNKSINNSSQHCYASYSGGNNAREAQRTSGNFATLKAWICQDGRPYNSSTVPNVSSFRMQDMVVTRDPRFEASFLDETWTTPTGLYVFKFINREGCEYFWKGGTSPAYYNSNTNENGFPCIRYAETVLNWLEAKAILADFFGGPAVTQADLDKSINAIRTRPLDQVAIDKGVKKTAPLTLAMVNTMNDPERTSDIQKTTLGYRTRGACSPLMWEIRRERRMEFFMESVRTLDIRRWGWLELMLSTNNPDIGVGGWVELDLARNKPADNPSQITNLKKTKNGVGYNLLTASNKGVVSVRHIEKVNADGSIVLGPRVFFDGSNYSEMRGFLVPQNFKDFDVRNVDVRNYLEPICTDVINQYKEKSMATGNNYTIYQNPGWEQ